MTTPAQLLSHRLPEASRDWIGLAPVRFDDPAEQCESEQLRCERERLRLLLRLNEVVASDLPWQEMSRAIVASLRAAVRCDAVALFLSDAESDELRLCAEAASCGDRADGQPVLPLTQELLGAVFQSGTPLIGGIAPFRSGCVLPVAAGGRAVGVLALARREECGFPVDMLELLAQLGKPIARAVEHARAVAEIAHLKAQHVVDKLEPGDEVGPGVRCGPVVGKSPALRRALKQIEMVGRTGSTVLIHGETGTGKEMLARAVHDSSDRRSGPFVKLNCAALPTGLLESELFGHEKGAFTGACAQRIGRFELAEGGTVFLDEIGEIPLELQPKLLRVLQEREFERVGGTRTLRSDIRVVAATNRDLKAMVLAGKFRSDLYYRLNVFPIQVPALRDRREDIPLLVRHFVEEFSRRIGKSIEGIPASIMDALCHYAWPGNIRELQNVLERAVILSSGPVLQVDTSDLDGDDSPRRIREIGVEPLPLKTVRDALVRAQRDEILGALRETAGRVGGPGGAAARLGLKRTTLIARMRKLGIESRSAA